MSDRTAVGHRAPVYDWLNNENPVYKYGIATLIVFGTLYVMQSYGINVWPVALVILVLFLVKSDFWRQWL